MNRLLALALLLPAIAFANSPLDGTWKSRIESLKFAGKPDVFEVNKGIYHCSSCVPEIKVKADGSPQKVTGHDYYDSVAVSAPDPTTIVVSNKMGAKPAATLTFAVSGDGGLLTVKVTDYSGAQPVNMAFTEKRVSPAAAGAHAASGSWQTEKATSMADVGRTLTYQTTDDGLKMNWNGQSYDAKFDGKDYPIANDPGSTTVSLKRVNANTIEETDKRNGKVVDVIRSTVSADGKTAKVVDKDPIHGSTTSYTMDKQP